MIPDDINGFLNKIGSLDFSKIPPKEGYSRHQYILVVDKPSWLKYSKNRQSHFMDVALGTDIYSIMLTEVVRDDDKFIAYRYWVDLPDNEFPFNGLTLEKYLDIRDKINNSEPFEDEDPNK